MAARRFRQMDSDGADSSRPPRAAAASRGASAEAGTGAARKRRADGGDSGDEYDSGGEVAPTAEDDAFIDREGDDAELLAEYDKEDQVGGLGRGRGARCRACWVELRVRV